MPSSLFPNIQSHDSTLSCSSLFLLKLKESSLQPFKPCPNDTVTGQAKKEPERATSCCNNSSSVKQYVFFIYSNIVIVELYPQGGFVLVRFGASANCNIGQAEFVLVAYFRASYILYIVEGLTCNCLELIFLLIQDIASIRIHNASSAIKPNLFYKTYQQTATYSCEVPCSLSFILTMLIELVHCWEHVMYLERKT